VNLTNVVASAVKLLNRVSDEIDTIITNPEVEARIDAVPANLGPYGVDPFGFDPQYLKRYAGLLVWMYRKYFRVQAIGTERIPEGRCLLVANHSGQLPFDAAMISTALFVEREPPRFVRSMLERFVPDTPFVSTFMARCGQILGTPENCRRVLSNGDAILVFPEGVGGLNKTWRERYHLQRFGQGFMRLAIETQTPIVPVVVIGAEEQAPSFFNAKALGKTFGLPAFPITATHPLIPGLGLLPLPVRYHIYFGEPLRFEGDANDEDEVIVKKVETVRSTMQAMVDDGLASRHHVFW